MPVANRRPIRDLLLQSIREGIFPAAAAELGDDGGPLWRDAVGRLMFEADSPDSPAATADTLFDLASLTKPIATTTLALDLIQQGRIDLDGSLAEYVPEWIGADRQAATVRDLLEHSAGLAPRLVDQPPEGRREFEHEICTMRLEYAPRERSIYSDLGFILLGFIVERRAGGALDALFEPNAGGLSFGVASGARPQAAPTWPLDEDRRRGRILVGEVHDNYAAALGGVAGHAGLFGTAAAVGAFARTTLARARSGALQIVKSTVPGSSRALGWDTMLPTSSCGVRLSPAAFGHTGFTGTSVWIDPVLNRYFVLLTNRACRGGSLDAMQRVRRAFHDLAAS